MNQTAFALSRQRSPSEDPSQQSFLSRTAKRVGLQVGYCQAIRRLCSIHNMQTL
jgi:hypothetical protein